MIGSRKPRHPRLVAEDRTSGAGGGGVDRQHRNLVTAFDQERPEHVDGGGLADAGRTGDADADRLAGIGQQRLQQIARRGLMVGAPAFDQRDRARQRRAAAAAQLLCQLADIELATSGHCAPSSSPLARAPPKILVPSGVK